MSMQARPWCAAALIGALFFSIDGVAFDNGEGHHHHRALVRARQKVFGIENVNPETGQVRDDRVIFSWLTNTTYGVSLKGRVFLLDSYINRLELEPGRTPLTIQDLVDLQPGAILLGHGHGDHADNAAYLAKMLDITIYSSPETCDVMQLDTARIFGEGTTVDCVGVVSRGSPRARKLSRWTFSSRSPVSRSSNTSTPDASRPIPIFHLLRSTTSPIRGMRTCFRSARHCGPCWICAPLALEVPPDRSACSISS